MNLFEIVKYGVNCREAAERYGVEANHYGMALCPFHNDRHPSLYVADDHYYCFACGEHGDVIDFVSKVAFNLTKRQIVCFAAALLFGLPLFFLLKDSTGTSLASMAMIAVMLPCFLFAMYEKHGQPLEVVVKNIIQTKFIAPKERPYRTDNFYSVLERQRKLEKEVSAIAKGNTKKQRGGKRKA